MTARSSAGMSASRMAASPPRKRGRQSRQDEARKGYEVDGFGRWRGYSAGSTPGRGVPGGGPAPRDDARNRRRRTDTSTGTTATLSRTPGDGPRVRQQPAASPFGRSPYEVRALSRVKLCG